MNNSWTKGFVLDRLFEKQFDMAYAITNRFMSLSNSDLKAFISWIGMNGDSEFENTPTRVSMIFRTTFNGKSYKMIVGPHNRESEKVFIISLHPVRRSRKKAVRKY